MTWTYISDVDAFEIYHQARAEEGHSDLSSKAAEVAASTLVPALRQALAGATGTAISNVVVYPLDLVVTRLKVQQRLKGSSNSNDSADGVDPHYRGIPDAFSKIYAKEGGIPAFYGGVTQDTIRSVIDSFLFFLAYNVLRRIRRRAGSPKNTLLQVLDQLSIGVAAGAFSKACTTPIQIVVTRKQIAAMASALQSKDDVPHTLGRKLSVTDIIRGIYEREGLAGFWSGYSATIFLTLNPSITFFLDSLFRKLLRSGKDTSAATTFLVAASAKAMSSALLYPLSLAKSRAQASGASSGDVKGDDGNSKSATKASKLENNILASLVSMARSNGIEALYAGLSGEVLKGFFAHGITMLAQQRVQPVVIKLYYLIASILRGHNSSKT